MEPGITHKEEKYGKTKSTKKSANLRPCAKQTVTSHSEKYGDGTPKLASGSIDGLRNQDTLYELDVRMGNMNIDIARIQETHNTISRECRTRNYRFVSAEAEHVHGATNEKGIGVVALMSKHDWGDNINKIHRRSRRRIEIILHTGQSKKQLHIINTYAPHMGYSKGDRGEYWEELKLPIGNIAKKDFVIWTTDNNGQIARPTNDTSENPRNAHIGKWHYAKGARMEMGPNSQKCFTDMK